MLNRHVTNNMQGHLSTGNPNVFIGEAPESCCVTTAPQNLCCLEKGGIMKPLRKLLILLTLVLFTFPAWADSVDGDIIADGDVTLDGDIASVTCQGERGNCEVMPTLVNCECADGSGSGLGGPGFEMTEAACLEILESSCALPPEICGTEKGICEVHEDGRFSCICADGSTVPDLDGDIDSDWIVPDGDAPVDGDDGPIPVDGDAIPQSLAPVVDGDVAIDGDEEQTTLACTAVLTDNCPNDPPNPADSCSTEALTLCNSIVDFVGDCTSEPSLAFRVILCCGMHAEDAQALEDMWTCIQQEGCDNFQTCFGGGEDGDAIADGDVVSVDGDSGQTTDGDAIMDGDITDGDILVDGDAIADGDTASPDGDDVTTDGDTVSPDGDDATTDGDTASPDGDTASPDGDDVTPDGDTASPDGDDATVDGDDATTDGDDSTTDGDTNEDDDDDGCQHSGNPAGLMLLFSFGLLALQRRRRFTL